MESFAALMMLGVRVREVVDLGKRAIWLPTEMLLLIDQALPCREREKVADQALRRALKLPAHPPR